MSGKTTPASSMSWSLESKLKVVGNTSVKVSQCSSKGVSAIVAGKDRTGKSGANMKSPRSESSSCQKLDGLRVAEVSPETWVKVNQWTMMTCPSRDMLCHRHTSHHH